MSLDIWHCTKIFLHFYLCTCVAFVTVPRENSSRAEQVVELPAENVLCFHVGRPYRGKPSDMWALGVVLFTMLYGQFPFYDSIPQELFRKIKAAEYSIPEWVSIISVLWYESNV